jgi:hypothetical protein
MPQGLIKGHFSYVATLVLLLLLWCCLLLLWCCFHATSDDLSVYFFLLYRLALFFLRRNLMIDSDCP